MNREEEIIYVDSPPRSYGGGYSSGMLPQMQDATIAEKRWEGDQLAWELYKVLSGKMPVSDREGNIKLVKINTNRAKLNDEGVEAVIMLVRSIVNPIVALTKFTDDEANSIIRQTERSLRKLLILNYHNYEIEEQEMDFIYNCVRTLIRAQIKRPQNGHEANNFKTQTIQQEQHSFQETKEGRSFSLFPNRGSR